MKTQAELNADAIAQAEDDTIDREARVIFGKLANTHPGSGPKLMVLRGVVGEHRAELRQLRKEVAAFRSLAAQVDKELALLREAEKALGYYADRKTYTYDNGLDEIRVLVDGGNRARTALKALEAASEG